MLIEVAAEHLAELGPRLERRQTDVGGDETLAVLDELQQLRFLRVLQRHLAVAHEEDRVDVAQVRPAARGRPVGLLRRRRDDVRVGADEGVPHARLVAEPLDDREGMADRFMLGHAVPACRPRRARACAAGAPPARPPRPCPRPRPCGRIALLRRRGGARRAAARGRLLRRRLCASASTPHTITASEVPSRHASEMMVFSQGDATIYPGSGSRRYGGSTVTTSVLTGRSV